MQKKTYYFSKDIFLTNSYGNTIRKNLLNACYFYMIKYKKFNNFVALVINNLNRLQYS